MPNIFFMVLISILMLMNACILSLPGHSETPIETKEYTSNIPKGYYGDSSIVYQEIVKRHEIYKRDDTIDYESTTYTKYITLKSVLIKYNYITKKRTTLIEVPENPRLTIREETIYLQDESKISFYTPKTKKFKPAGIPKESMWDVSHDDKLVFWCIRGITQVWDMDYFELLYADTNGVDENYGCSNHRFISYKNNHYLLNGSHSEIRYFTFDSDNSYEYDISNFTTDMNTGRVQVYKIGWINWRHSSKGYSLPEFINPSEKLVSAVNQLYTIAGENFIELNIDENTYLTSKGIYDLDTGEEKFRF